MRSRSRKLPVVPPLDLVSELWEKSLWKVVWFLLHVRGSFGVERRDFLAQRADS